VGLIPLLRFSANQFFFLFDRLIFSTHSSSFNDLFLCPCGQSPDADSLFCCRECAIRDAIKTLSSPPSQQNSETTDAISSSLVPKFSFASSDVAPSSWRSRLLRRSDPLIARKWFQPSKGSKSLSLDLRQITPSSPFGTHLVPLRRLKHTKAYANLKRATRLFFHDKAAHSQTFLEDEQDSVTVSDGSPTSATTPESTQITLRHVRRAASVPQFDICDDILTAMCNPICEESILVANSLYQRWTYV
jgi:hypothetical protein